MDFYKLIIETVGTTVTLCGLLLMLKTVQIRTRAQEKGLITDFRISLTIQEELLGIYLIHHLKLFEVLTLFLV